MSVSIKSGSSVDKADIANEYKSLHSSVVPRDRAYSLAATTGTMTAGLAAAATVFAMRLGNGAPRVALVQRVVLTWTTVAAFTTAVTAGRRLTLVRAGASNASGGTAISPLPRKDQSMAPSWFDQLYDGDARISGTAALTAPSFFETPNLNFGDLLLAGFGSAGANTREEFDFVAEGGNGMVLFPGIALLVRNGSNAMDAGGTWNLNVRVDWIEVPI